ncbi:MAG: DUF3144 domain-containing protein [Xanthomonadales bacterium]|nr:DUF3144 domain-containing protein [Xanthomonadales bacterium]NIN60173.1 DUF3144 domain-containing protein [Xanthomonadales bacterium]NIN74320.1 DUF3144 domain-containing protein [Xanthomonadales bacterium]NIO12829.1 DUF3144 domain-containing protein [Xanthomonadales bacterium]NIP12566.1 DUF3144 domain-containing protein [Xanthomonadales bacterium]
MNDRESHNQCTGKFIELANQLKDEGFDVRLVSAALMSASGVYATYVAAGNTGALQPSGVEKVTEAYRRSLEHIQEAKKAQASAATEAGSEETRQ